MADSVSCRSAKRPLRLVGIWTGMAGFVKHSADLLLGIGSFLTLTGSLLNFRAISDGPDPRSDDRPWRVKFADQYRRHPRLRGGATVCLLVALIVYIVYAVALLG